MSHPGIPGPGRIVNWSGHDLPSINSNGNGNGLQKAHQPSRQFGSSQPQHRVPPSSDFHVGGHQSTHVQYNREGFTSQPSVDVLKPALPAESPTSSHPQFINPAQLFQQPQYPTISQPSFSQQAATPASNTSIRMPSTIPPVSQLDRSAVLISLAEEYFDVAHALAPSVSHAMTVANVEAYQKLISTGLACLDTAMKHVRLAPRLEANIRLRYAGILYEETENFMEAETALSKGIALCERVNLASLLQLPSP